MYERLYEECLLNAQAIGFCHSINETSKDALVFHASRVARGKVIVELGTGVGAGIATMLGVVQSKGFQVFSFEKSILRINAIPAEILRHPLVKIIQSENIGFLPFRRIGLLIVDCPFPEYLLKYLLSKLDYGSAVLVDEFSGKNVECIAAATQLISRQGEVLAFKKKRDI